jgi:hypothetical protein
MTLDLMYRNGYDSKPSISLCMLVQLVSGVDYIVSVQMLQKGESGRMVQ